MGAPEGYKRMAASGLGLESPWLALGEPFLSLHRQTFYRVMSGCGLDHKSVEDGSWVKF